MEGMDHLSLLYLHDNAITDMGTSLKALKSLMMLDIGSNQLTKVIIPLKISIPVLLPTPGVPVGPRLAP